MIRDDGSFERECVEGVGEEEDIERTSEATAKTPGRVKVPLDASAKSDDGVAGGGDGNDVAKDDLEVLSGENSAIVRSDAQVGDGGAEDASARAAETREDADARTPKDVKKIEWQTAGGSNEVAIGTAARSVKRVGAPASVVKVNAEEATEDDASAKAVHESPGSSGDKKKRAKARANGMAFLKADIPALTVKPTTAGGAPVSTELKISPRTLAARKANEEAKALEAAKAKASMAAVVTPQPVQSFELTPKQPMDQRSLMESFMIQPESSAPVSAAAVVPLSARPAPTPTQLKAFHALSFQTPGKEILAERQQTPRLPASIAPVVSIGEANDVMSRLKRAMEARSRADEENKRRLESQLRQKEEERRLREQEMEARKARQASDEAREREERRLRQQRLMEIRSAEEEIQRKAAIEKNKLNQMLEEQKRMTEMASANTSLKRPLVAPQNGYQVASSDAEKRRRLLEDAQAAINGHQPATSTSTTLAQPQSSAMRTPTRSIFKTNFATSSTNSSNSAPFNDESYAISPYASSDDEDDEKPRKSIPLWARGAALVPQLKAQSYVDPDDIFSNPSLTCSLGKIFKKPSQDRRRSSSNWSHDRLTLKEELTYKQQMGFRKER